MSASDPVAPTLYAVTITSTLTQYSQALSRNSKYFSIKCRTSGPTLRVAFVTGKVATPTDPYFSILPGQVYNSPEKMSNGGLTVYLASDTAGAIAEIVEWADST